MLHMTETSSPTTTTAKPPTYRSPSYPAYDLETALQRAVKLHELANTHSVNVSTAVNHWGYTVKSSKGAQVLAATKKFGLTADKGKGDARVIGLTQLGRELVYYTEASQGSDAWVERARAAALTPSLHRELWNRYEGQLPLDGVIKDYLVLDRRFSPSAAEEAIGVFRRTLDFAGITAVNGATIKPPSEGEPHEEEADPMPAAAGPTPAADPLQRPTAGFTPATDAAPTGGGAPALAGSAPAAVNILLSENGWASISTSGRLSEEQWNQFMAILTAMKPGFLRS